MRNKKAMSLSIVLLVLATLILSGFALFTFNMRQKEISEKIQITNFLENIYAKESKINFYAENILRKMDVKGLSLEQFKDKFTTELNRPKKVETNWEFTINEPVSLDGKKAVISLTIKITGKGIDKEGEEIASSIYEYDKTFEKTLS